MLVQSYDDTDGGEIIDFAVPLEFSKVRVGALYLGFSDRSIRQTIERARNQTIWITGLMIVGGIRRRHRSVDRIDPAASQTRARDQNHCGGQF